MDLKYRSLRRPLALLSALFSLSIAADARAASLYTTTCHAMTGTTVLDQAIRAGNVNIVRRVGAPPTDDVHRREHARISGGLATALGIDPLDVSPTGVSPQVRVSLGTNLANANFTVDAVDAADLGLTLAVWLPDDLANNGSFSDKDNGFFKLFGNQNPGPVFFTPPSGFVYDVAPGTTVVVSGGVDTRHVHFTEPNNPIGKQFRECVELRGDDRVAVLVPHSGGIDGGMSYYLVDLLSQLHSHGYDPSAWAGSGEWGGGSTFQQWHITATQISEAAFPGYAQLAASGTYQYAVALGGFVRNERAVVLGGRSSRQVKCHLVQEIEDHLFGSGLEGMITYKIYGPDGPEVDVLRESTGPGDTPVALTNVAGLAGLATEDIVNRISPNATGARGFGGIQVEMSSTLRNELTLDVQFLAGLAAGLDQELLLDPITDFCAQYE